MNVNAIIIRAFKTFVQGFAAYWVVTGNSLDKAALTGAVAAGVSALMNLLIQPTEAK